MMIFINLKSKNLAILYFTLFILILSLAYISCDNRSTKVVLVTNIEFESEEITLIIGDSQPLNITITPENATNKEVEWESSNTEIVDVTEDGILTAV